MTRYACLEVLTNKGYRMQQFLLINAGLHTHSPEHVDGIFCRAITCRTWRERATAQPASGSLQASYAMRQCHEGVGQRHTVGVMQVQTDIQQSEPPRESWRLNFLRKR